MPSITTRPQLDQKKLAELCLTGSVYEQITLIQSHIDEIKALPELSEHDQRYLAQWEAELAKLKKIPDQS